MKSKCLGLITVLLSLALVEAGAQCAYRWRSPQHLWIAQAAALQPRLFRRHPYLAVAGVPGVRAQFGATVSTHNSLGYRGPEPSRKQPARTRIVALGGSSTYGVYVTDEDTWPARLARRLGPQAEVLNMGVPGYTTVEHVIQTAFEFGDLQPDIALYYVGWNDLRMTHVSRIDAMYARFHGSLQPTSLQTDEPAPGRVATAYYVEKLWARAGARLRQVPIEPGPGAYTATADPRALALFTRNLRTIAALCRRGHVQPVFIPNVFNCVKLTSEQPYGWAPFVRDRDLCAVSAAYNRALERVAEQEQVPVMARVLDPGAFYDTDFLDQGHFTATGAQRFATYVADALESMPRPARP